MFFSQSLGMWQVDLEIARQREVKMGTSSKDEAQDKGLALLRLK